MKNITPEEKKNTASNGRLDSISRKKNEIEDKAIKNIQKETQRKIFFKK